MHQFKSTYSAYTVGRQFLLKSRITDHTQMQKLNGMRMQFLRGLYSGQLNKD